MTIVLEGRHFLFLLGKVVYNNTGAFMPLNTYYIGGHEIYPPLGEGPHCDDGKQRSGMQPYLPGIKLTRMTMLYSFHTILKDDGPEVAYT